jgi:hypothetical protein
MTQGRTGTGKNKVKKDTGGAGTHTGHTRGKRAHTGTRITQTNLTTILAHQRTHALDRTTAETGTLFCVPAPPVSFYR